MPLYITSLNSGSNGNCYYVGNGQDAVLIDAGISRKQTELRMARLGLSLDTVRAIFVSHEHSDHVRGIHHLASAYRLPVYITTQTRQSVRLPDQKFPIKPFRSHESVWIGDLCVKAFPKYHDACDPHSFVVSYGDIRVGVLTDIGMACDEVVAHFSQCDAAFLEANYDEQMLASGPYPFVLKRRIQGGRGHLSNQQALALLRAHKPAHMSHVLLAHLSKDNNDPELVRQQFAPHMDRTELVIASRYEETPVYTIGA